MPIRHREPKPEEELDFDDKGDTGEREKYKPKPLFRKINYVDSDGTQDGLLETDRFISDLTGDALASREE